MYFIFALVTPRRAASLYARWQSCLLFQNLKKLFGKMPNYCIVAMGKHDKPLTFPSLKSCIFTQKIIQQGVVLLAISKVQIVGVVGVVLVPIQLWLVSYFVKLTWPWFAAATPRPGAPYIWLTKATILVLSKNHRPPWYTSENSTNSILRTTVVIQIYF